MKKYLASLMFFTRLPLWRVVKVRPELFRRAVDCWSSTGWVTGGFTALLFWCLQYILPGVAAVILALAGRAMLTGALHEDGLADFFDGFGAGGGRERILAIMKDSHIGAYGVIGLILYYLLAVATLVTLPRDMILLLLFAADPWCKFCASQIINILPYCRDKESAKNKTVYSRMSPAAFILSAIAGLLPLAPMGALLDLKLLWGAVAALCMSLLLILFLRVKIGGYTGDCCGATFLLSELTFFITGCAVYTA